MGHRIGSLVFWIALWGLVAFFANSPLLPSPDAVFRRVIGEAASGELLYHGLITLMRVSASFIIAMILGVIIGALLGEFRELDRYFDTLVITTLNLPLLVVALLCYLWIGLNEIAAITAVTLNKLPVVIVTVREGAKAINRDLLEVGRAFELPFWMRFWHFYLPQLYSYIFAAARNGLALIWKIALVVELLGRSNGIGFQLHLQFQLFDVTGVLAYSLAFATVILLFDFLCLQPIAHRLNAYRH